MKSQSSPAGICTCLAVGAWSHATHISDSPYSRHGPVCYWECIIIIPRFECHKRWRNRHKFNRSGMLCRSESCIFPAVHRLLLLTLLLSHTFSMRNTVLLANINLSNETLTSSDMQYGLILCSAVPVNSPTAFWCAGIAGDLVICRVSRPYGSVRGGDEVFLLCSSVRQGAFVFFRWWYSPLDNISQIAGGWRGQTHSVLHQAPLIVRKMGLKVAWFGPNCFFFIP